MIKSYDALSSTHDDISEYIGWLESTTGGSNIPFVEDETVMQLQECLEERVADAASDMKTGAHRQHEEEYYREMHEVYCRLLGAVALDMAERVYDTSEGDADEVKQAVLGYLLLSKMRMVALDYKYRLKKSRIERSKQWVAHHRKTGFALSMGASALTTSVLFRASENYSSLIDMTPRQGGMWGVMTVLGAMAIRSAFRTGPTRVGSAVSGRFNATLESYRLNKSVKEYQNSGEDLLVALAEESDSLPVQYASRHLESLAGRAGLHSQFYDIEGKESLKPMVDHVLRVTESSMNESYNVKPLGTPWYRRVLSFE